MSTLVAIAYPDVYTANQVRDRLMGLQRENLIKLEDAAVVEKRQDGKIKLHQARSTTGSGAAWGAVWGGLIGMIFFMPLLGMAMGAGGGALGGAMTDYGVDDRFMKDLGASLQPGGAVLFLLIVQSTPDKVVPQIAEYGGTIIKTSLSEEQEAHLRELAQASTS
ncbi:DUF1269 domain-containing protein [Actinocorallia longicatena]|uniref:DUF1269 domain-containing protein n=1 Tax=Actinocorallia longicatena TaxID=111803 RepID=A0ABP6QCP9_9ACTN